ncbi:MAG: hypothetical protein MHM6MM_005790 [Cercozoa sp. M6MM]
MTYNLVGTQCESKGTYVQDRIAMTRFTDYYRTGQETIKLYAGAAAYFYPSEYQKFDLTVEFVPKYLSKGKVAAYLGVDTYDGDMTLLDTSFECPKYKDEVPAEYFEMAESVCGTLLNRPVTTSPPDVVDSAASVSASALLVLAAICTFQLLH